jgi:hypothetical protein
MLIEVENHIVSTQIFERKFVCDLNACKGACCIEGDAGAPLTLEEIDILEEDFDKIKPFMRQEGIDAVLESGVFYMDEDNEPVTTLIHEKECAFVFFDEKGITKCAVEQAYLSGETTFKKPISCHLYPIRVMKYEKMDALTYNEWDICAPACACGEALNVPVYQFLKEPITRRFGEDFFVTLQQVDQKLKDDKLI